MVAPQTSAGSVRMKHHTAAAAAAAAVAVAAAECGAAGSAPGEDTGDGEANCRYQVEMGQ